jgi:hypothetical protein
MWTCQDTYYCRISDVARQITYDGVKINDFIFEAGNLALQLLFNSIQKLYKDIPCRTMSSFASHYFDNIVTSQYQFQVLYKSASD